MKTGNLFRLMGLAAVTIVTGAGLSVAARAQDAAPAPSLTVPAVGSPVATATTPGQPDPNAIPAPGAPVAGIPGAAVVGSTATNAPGAMTIPAVVPTPGMPSVVNDAMQNLRQTQAPLTLNDIAKAQDASARLDLMLDLQKKINEVKKAQDEHNPAAAPISSPFGAPNLSGMQIPASALSLPPGGLPSTPAAPSKPAKVAKSIDEGTGKYEVEEISGTNGVMTAMITTPDGAHKNVHVGDKLGERTTVASISTKGVRLSGPKGSQTITIENNGLTLAPLTR